MLNDFTGGGQIFLYGVLCKKYNKWFFTDTVIAKQFAMLSLDFIWRPFKTRGKVKFC
ncbi:MAG: hypothetical protein LN568_02775 [Rickettsia endosymbiont of Pseudomimeciton antennatum]|nr:hypothetical protein [Rickettsia endosymbiont of Pseudomimeciton antennatum]